MNQTGSRDLKIWLADGTNYPGQGDIRGRQDWLAEGLAAIYAQLGDDQRLVLEYKFFEPAFYHTDVPDWGTSYVHCVALGDKAVVCLDTGHHAPGHQHRVHRRAAAAAREARLVRLQQPLLRRRRPDRRRADPFQLFRILVEVIRGGGFGPDSDVAFMLDQCHNIEEKIPGQIRSVLNVQEMTARALLARHRCARRRAQPTATCSAPTRSSWTRSTPTYARDLAAVARGARPAGRPDGGVPRQRLPGADRGRPRRRRPGRMELT